MTTFIQLHLLTAYPAANLNRDDTGAPKTVMLGGATRLRISSQSLKRAWRTSELFEHALAGHIGIRSGRIAREAAEILVKSGIEPRKAVDYVKAIGECFGKVKTKADQNDPLKCSETEQLAHISPAEFDAVKALAHRLAEEKRAATKEEAALLLEGHAAEVLRQAYRQYQERFNLLRLSLRQLQDQCWWEGEHAGLVANKILRRRDCPLNRQHWLFGERSMNQGTWLSKEETCTSQE